MNDMLGKPVSLEELRQAAQAMAKERAPGPDGINVATYLTHWLILGEEFKTMLDSAVRNNSLPPGMTRDMLALLFKSGEREDLCNWIHITLLNTSYKILAKILQLRLKPLLAEVIDLDQTAFLPTRFILDNILVTSETIDHAKRTKQTLIYLKLDFRKAFDRVD